MKKFTVSILFILLSLILTAQTNYKSVYFLGYRTFDLTEENFNKKIYNPDRPVWKYFQAVKDAAKQLKELDINSKKAKKILTSITDYQLLLEERFITLCIPYDEYFLSLPVILLLTAEHSNELELFKILVDQYIAIKKERSPYMSEYTITEDINLELIHTFYKAKNKQIFTEGYKLYKQKILATGFYTHNEQFNAEHNFFSLLTQANISSDKFLYTGPMVVKAGSPYDKGQSAKAGFYDCHSLKINYLDSLKGHQLELTQFLDELLNHQPAKILPRIYFTISRMPKISQNTEYVLASPLFFSIAAKMDTLTEFLLSNKLDPNKSLLIVNKDTDLKYISDKYYNENYYPPCTFNQSDYGKYSIAIDIDKVNKDQLVKSPIYTAKQTAAEFNNNIALTQFKDIQDGLASEQFKEEADKKISQRKSGLNSAIASTIPGLKKQLKNLEPDFGYVSFPMDVIAVGENNITELKDAFTHRLPKCYVAGGNLSNKQLTLYVIFYGLYSLYDHTLDFEDHIFRLHNVEKDIYYNGRLSDSQTGTGTLSSGKDKYGVKIIFDNYTTDSLDKLQFEFGWIKRSGMSPVGYFSKSGNLWFTHNNGYAGSGQELFKINPAIPKPVQNKTEVVNGKEGLYSIINRSYAILRVEESKVNTGGYTSIQIYTNNNENSSGEGYYSSISNRYGNKKEFKNSQDDNNGNIEKIDAFPVTVNISYLAKNGKQVSATIKLFKGAIITLESSLWE